MVEHAREATATAAPVCQCRQAQLRRLMKTGAEAEARLDENGGEAIVGDRGDALLPRRPHDAEAGDGDRPERRSRGGRTILLRLGAEAADHAAAHTRDEIDRGAGRGLVGEPPGFDGDRERRHPVAVGGRLRGVDDEFRRHEAACGRFGGGHGPLVDADQPGRAFPEPGVEIFATQDDSTRKFDARLDRGGERPRRGSGTTCGAGVQGVGLTGPAIRRDRSGGRGPDEDGTRAAPGRRYDDGMSSVIQVVITVALCGWAVGSAASAADGAEADAIREARSRYAGTWKVVAVESNGDRKTEEGRAIVVTNEPDGTWTLSVDGRAVSRGTSRIDPLANPSEIDIEITEGEGKGGEWRGIYEVTETSRRLCFRGSDGWRPREFATAPGCGAVLVLFERQ